MIAWQALVSVVGDGEDDKSSQSSHGNAVWRKAWLFWLFDSAHPSLITVQRMPSL